MPGIPLARSLLTARKLLEPPASGAHAPAREGFVVVGLAALLAFAPLEKAATVLLETRDEEEGRARHRAPPAAASSSCAEASVACLGQ